jgi:hypothetical protein
MFFITYTYVRGIDHVLDGIELTRRRPPQCRELCAHVVTCRCRR